MQALIIGATGATGKDLLDLLLKDATFERVDIFVRRPVDVQHEKLFVHSIDFDDVVSWQHFVKGDVLFSCLGTTLEAAGSKEAQWKIDYDYQYNFAQTAQQNGVHSLLLVSSNFASPQSSFFYTKIKGQLEVDVQALGFRSLHIFRPPSLIRKNSDRSGEKFGMHVIKFFNAIGLFRSQRPLPTEVLAKAMINASKGTSSTFMSYTGEEIWKMSKI